jgi:glycosyltransferase involved in cell wall biosynthesis
MKQFNNAAISIIICTYNRASSLKKCLQSLTKQTFKDFEVIIVDGNSTDSTPSVIKKFSAKLKIKLIIEPKKHLALARDLGWRQAKGKYVSWIDDDVIISPRWIESIINLLDQNPNIAGVSGPTIIPPHLLKNRLAFFWHQNPSLFAKLWVKFFLLSQPYAIGKILPTGAWTPGSNFPPALKLKKPIPVNYLEACNMTLRRHLVKKVNGFNLKYRGTSEWCEPDLAIRIKNLGFQLLFSSEIKVEHHPSRSGAFSHRFNLPERLSNFLRFYFKHIFPS